MNKKTYARIKKACVSFGVGRICTGRWGCEGDRDQKRFFADQQVCPLGAVLITSDVSSVFRVDTCLTVARYLDLDTRDVESFVEGVDDVDNWGKGGLPRTRDAYRLAGRRLVRELRREGYLA